MRRQGVEKPSPSVTVCATASSLEGFYAEYRERLLRFVRPRVGGDQQTAEDVVQEAFAAALISITRFEARSSPFTWLCSIAQHKIADHYRKQLPGNGAYVDSADADGRGDFSDGSDADSPVEHWIETEETRDLVQRALRQLPAIYATVLRLKYFDGLSVVEVGTRLGRSPRAVDGLLARARRELQRRLA